MREPLRGWAIRSFAALCILCAGAMPASADRPECAPWQACRDAALAAAAAGNFEHFHDLAWRTVQTGPPRDPDLMLLLARAMSLSGRPGDALVMLRRLAERGVPLDAAIDDDFRRVRAIAAWSEVEALIVAAGGPPSVAEPLAPAIAAVESPAEAPPDSSAEPIVAPEAATPAGPASGTDPDADTASSTDSPGRTAGTATPSPEDVVPTPPVTEGLASAVPLLSMPPTGAQPPGEALRFPRARLTSPAFAYDAVSGRFLLGSDERKIVVVAEETRRFDDLVRADSAGFLDITAMAIDPRRGDLWVTSSENGETTATSMPSDGNGAGANPADPSIDGVLDGDVGNGLPRPLAALHKVQLISGRPLQTWRLHPDEGSARFVDLAVTDGGLVVVLDAAGKRLYRLAPGSARLDRVAELGGVEVISLAQAGNERHVYVALAEGLVRVDLTTGRTQPVGGPTEVETHGVRRLRWHKGALVGLQRLASGDDRVVRFTLSDGGRAVSAATVLDVVSGAGDDEGVAAVAGDEFYYTAHAAPVSGDGDESVPRETVVRRVPLR